MRILIAEDRWKMADMLERALGAEGHTVLVARDGISALRIALNAEFDVLVLDVMLPGMDGFSVMRNLRLANSSISTLMLTAKDTAADIVQGLDSGADDYLIKPFELSVLCARIRALGRRSKDSRVERELVCDDLTLSPATRSASRGLRIIPLTRIEYALLEFLMRNQGCVITRDKLIEYGWGIGSETDEGTLYVFIGNLRRKINLEGEMMLLHTVRGTGYTIKSADRA